jgi:hypothetical protein
MGLESSLTRLSCGCKPEEVYPPRAAHNNTDCVVLDLVEVVLSACFKSKWRREIRLRAHLIAKSYHRNPLRITGLIKSACHNLRDSALTGAEITVGYYLVPRAVRWHFKCLRDFARTKVLMQLSMLGRALPPICGRVRSFTAVQKLKETFETPVTQVLPAEFDRVVAKCAFFKPKNVDPRTPTWSPGSALGYPRKVGGFTRSMQESVTLFKRTKVFSPPAVEARKVSEVHVIHEQGAKMRPVTSSQPGVLHHGHDARRRTFNVLERHRSTAVPLQGGTMRIHVPDDDQVRALYSADLSDATNLVSHDTIRRTCLPLRINPDSVESHHCFYNDRKGHSLDIDPVRGTFMGLPPSWIVLSISHRAICSMVDPSGLSFFLKGDDLVAFWTTDMWARYLELMTQAGYVINSKKSFISSNYAWFCERGYFLEGGHGHFVLIPMQVFSLRFISKFTVDETGKPPWLSALQRYSEVCTVANRAASTVLRRILRRRVPKWYLDTVRDPSLPIQYGGLGFRPRDDKKKLLRPRSAAMYRDILNGNLKPLSIMDYRISSGAVDFVHREYSELLKLPLRHYTTGKTRHGVVITPSSLMALTAPKYRDAVIELQKSVRPTDETAKPPIRKLYKLHRSGFARRHTITYRDAYLLGSRMGIYLPPSKPMVTGLPVSRIVGLSRLNAMSVKMTSPGIDIFDFDIANVRT